MKKFLFITTILFLLVASIAQAHEDESDFNKFLGIDTEELNEEETIQTQKDAVMDNLDKVATKMNEQIASLPAAVQTILGDIKVNIYLEGGDVLGMTLEDGKISSLTNEAVEDPNMNVHISDNVFIYLNNGSFDPIEAIDSGDITYEGVGFKGKIKSGLIAVALKLFA